MVAIFDFESRGKVRRAGSAIVGGQGGYEAKGYAPQENVLIKETCHSSQCLYKHAALAPILEVLTSHFRKPSYIQRNTHLSHGQGKFLLPIM